MDLQYKIQHKHLQLQYSTKFSTHTLLRKGLEIHTVHCTVEKGQMQSAVQNTAQAL